MKEELLELLRKTEMPVPKKGKARLDNVERMVLGRVKMWFAEVSLSHGTIKSIPSCLRC